MLAFWFWAALLLTVIPMYLTLFVRSQRQPEGRAWLRSWLRLYLYILRRPLQAVRDFGWGVGYLAIFLLVCLVPIVLYSGLLLGTHATSMVIPGCFWPIVVLPPLTVVGFVRQLRTTGTSTSM